MRKKKRKKRKILILAVELVILCILAVVLYLYRSMGLIQNEAMDDSKIKVNEVTEETQQQFEGYTTIALFGLDNRSQGVYDTGNSDCMIILNINNDTKEMKMVSLYRDTFLNVAAIDEKDRFRKANAAYSAGGAEQAILMMNRNLDLDIDNYISFDFRAVAEAVDVLGGIEINIESEAELGYLNDYIGDTAKWLDKKSSLVEGTGVHTLNGVQAVSYARIRYTKGGDYKRTERQRKVFTEMIKKAKKANIIQLNELINTVFPNIKTDLTSKQMISMASSMAGYDMANSSGFPYEKTSSTLSKKVGSVVIPCDLISNVKSLHKELFGTEDYTPSSTVVKYNQQIIQLSGFDASDAVHE